MSEGLEALKDGLTVMETGIGNMHLNIGVSHQLTLHSNNTDHSSLVTPPLYPHPYP